MAANEVEYAKNVLAGAVFLVGSSGAELIALVKRAAQHGTMVNFTFHGIGGDHLTVSAQAHAELLAYLAANRDIYRTDTFLNIMRHVRAQQAKWQQAK